MTQVWPGGYIYTVFEVVWVRLFELIQICVTLNDQSWDMLRRLKWFKRLATFNGVILLPRYCTCRCVWAPHPSTLTISYIPETRTAMTCTGDCYNSLIVIRDWPSLRTLYIRMTPALTSKLYHHSHTTRMTGRVNSNLIRFIMSISLP